jgi:hypothetical protein
MLASRRFPPPWSVEEQSVCFVVRDHSGQQLAYVYFEGEPGRRSGEEILRLRTVGFGLPIPCRGRCCATYRARYSPGLRNALGKPYSAIKQQTNNKQQAKLTPPPDSTPEVVPPSPMSSNRTSYWREFAPS